MKCYCMNLTGAYMLRGLLKAGFTLEHSIYYDEFEFNGEKPFKDVPPSKIFYEPNRPACYLVAIYDTDIIRKME